MTDMAFDPTDELAAFLRALVDTERLQIAGLLARKAHTAEALAAELELKPALVARQLVKLAEAGLVRAEITAGNVRYALQLEAARALAGRLAARPAPPVVSEEVAEFDRHVLVNFLHANGSLKELPLQEKKLQVVLRYLRERLEARRELVTGQRYSEKEINTALARYHADVAALRRYLVDAGFLRRTPSGREYWLAETQHAQSVASER